MIQTINKNKYKITVDCGKVNGKRKRISRIFNGNKKDAKILESELKKQIMNNDTSFIKNKGLTFNEVIDMFIKDYCKTNLKENTIYGYKSLLVNIRKELGNNNIKDITTYTLQTYYNRLKADYKYSSNTINHYYTLINNILEKALKWGIITNNPNKQINKPKIIKEEANFYTQEDIKELLNILENYTLEMKLPIILCIDTGFRREELNGLQWNDIDFNNNTINVNRVRLAVGKKTVIEEPKTTNSKRTVQISEFCINLLKELKEEQKKLYKDLNKVFKENYFVFVNEYGEALYPDTISKRFKKILVKNNLKKITFHELRHTSATLLINSNIDINSVSKRLGHANVSTTLNIYTHVLDKTKQEMANKMNDILTNS